MTASTRVPERSSVRGKARTETPAPQTSVRSSFVSARISLSRVFAAESANYYFLLAVTLFMVVFGLVMVLSSSSIDSGSGGGSFFARFLTQGLYAVIGVPIMLIASRAPASFWRWASWPALLASLVLQLLVVATPLGSDNGTDYNKNWLQIGSVALQPSEAIKIALILWIGMFVARKQDRLKEWKYGLLPVLLVSSAAIGLVLAGGDLGTTSIILGIVIGTLFFAGIPMRQLLITGVIALGGAILFAVSRASRLQRILGFLHPSSADPLSTGWQIQQSNFALAHGSIMGVGLGNSQSKWNWLPEADTDFIFSIIGEELGLLGAIVVLVLFILLTVCFIRIMNASKDPFARVVTGGVMVWLVGQGLVNIGVVLGLLPVLGVPLPLISAGGTALISSLFAIGVVLSFARSTTASPSARGRKSARA
ncbi:putative lipid II flippase FtsW [Humibacter ginsenosidimutans]|uniref:Probable peptidoglycan glycosyltransferase FtsW n=1 Tax=Humibacter ginsenosidimutans TaxID=2599293 RepID=A0A5B8M0A0_9MICO|nr:putative lipid II flippase FtsW [Humibacter ginsenosidimutans]QDZ13676.1 putative lipid II flippase FtsW [Humibacter ginsenosidimutans]